MAEQTRAVQSGEETTPLLAATRETQNGAADENGVREAGTFTRNLGTVEAFAIVISIVIGSGVFTSPGSIDSNVPSPGAALLIWLVGGGLAWTGASTMAELGTAIPGEGGVQPYLKYIFGDVFGFLAGWTWIIAVMPATLAILSIAFVESIYTAAGITDQAGRIEHKLFSILILLVVSAANSISTKASTRLNNFFVTTKFFTIAAVVIAGTVLVIGYFAGAKLPLGGGDWYRHSWFDYRTSHNADGSETHWQELSTWELLGHYSAAIYGALWAYSGWDKAIYVSAELAAPARQLPLAINTAVPVILLCYVTANAAYYIMLPWSVISTTDSVAVAAFTGLWGRGFGIAIAVLICLVIAGSILGNQFVAGRMTVAAAGMGWLPRTLGVIGRIGVRATNEDSAHTQGDSSGARNAPVSDAPINAILLSAILSSLYILFGSFRDLLVFNGLGEYSFFFLTVLGALVLRFREPTLKRPYKTILFNPCIFTLVSGFVVVRGAIFAPIIALVLVVVWAIGLVFYWGWLHWNSRTTTADAPQSADESS